MAMIAACALEPGVYFAINARPASWGRPRSRPRPRSRAGASPSTPRRWHALAQERRREDAARPHRRRAVARGRHGAHLLPHDRRRAPARALVPLRDHVRGAVHPDHARRRHARRPLHGPGAARPRLGAARPHGSWTEHAAGERAHRRGAGATSSTRACSTRSAASTRSGRSSASPTSSSPRSRSCVATTILIKMGRRRYVWVTLVPLAWLLTVTMTAAGRRSSTPTRASASWRRRARSSSRSPTARVPPEKVADTRRVVFNNRLDAGVTLLFAGSIVLLIAEAALEWFRLLTGRAGRRARGAVRAHALARRRAVTAPVGARDAALAVRQRGPAHALRALWRSLRQWSGDAAYETYLARAGEGAPLDREGLLPGLARERRYRGAEPLLLRHEQPDRVALDREPRRAARPRGPSACDRGRRDPRQQLARPPSSAQRRVTSTPVRSIASDARRVRVARREPGDRARGHEHVLGADGERDARSPTGRSAASVTATSRPVVRAHPRDAARVVVRDDAPGQQVLDPGLGLARRAPGARAAPADSPAASTRPSRSSSRCAAAASASPTLWVT